MNKIYQVYTITNMINNKVYLSYTKIKASLATKYFSTNKSLFDDIKIYGIKNFNRVILMTASTKNEVQKIYREKIVELRNSGVQLYNDMCAYGFIYLTTDVKNDMKYIGQHRITGNPKIDDNYFGSGTVVKKIMKKYGSSIFDR